MLIIIDDILYECNILHDRLSTTPQRELNPFAPLAFRYCPYRPTAVLYFFIKHSSRPIGTITADMVLMIMNCHCTSRRFVFHFIVI